MNGVLSMQICGADGPGEAVFGCAFESDLSALHPNERVRWESMRFEARRSAYLLGRCAAKAALCQWLGEGRPGAIEIASGELGRPLVRHASGRLPGVTISHSSGCAVALVFPKDCRAGIDVERADSSHIEALRLHFTPHERVLAAGAPMPETAWTLLWTAREALSKALGYGLIAPSDFLSVGSLSIEGGAGGGTFQNFPQYGFHSVVAGRMILSIVLPRDSAFEFPAAAIRKMLLPAAP